VSARPIGKQTRPSWHILAKPEAVIENEQRRSGGLVPKVDDLSTLPESTKVNVTSVGLSCRAKPRKQLARQISPPIVFA